MVFEPKPSSLERYNRKWKYANSRYVDFWLVILTQAHHFWLIWYGNGKDSRIINILVYTDILRTIEIIF